MLLCFAQNSWFQAWVSSWNFRSFSCRRVSSVKRLRRIGRKFDWGSGGPIKSTLSLSFKTITGFSRVRSSKTAWAWDWGDRRLNLWIIYKIIVTVWLYYVRPDAIQYFTFTICESTCFCNILLLRRHNAITRSQITHFYTVFLVIISYKSEKSW